MSELINWLLALLALEQLTHNILTEVKIPPEIWLQNRLNKKRGENTTNRRESKAALSGVEYCSTLHNVGSVRKLENLLTARWGMGPVLTDITQIMILIMIMVLGLEGKIIVTVHCTIIIESNWTNSHTLYYLGNFVFSMNKINRWNNDQLNHI